MKTDVIPEDIPAETPTKLGVDERSGTLVRGLKLLEILAAGLHPLTLGEIATESGLDQSTTHRLLRTLEEAGYVIRSETTKRFLPSPKLLSPLPLLHPLSQLRRESNRLVSQLAQRTAKTVILALFFGTERMVLEIASVPGSITPYYGNWLKGPLHATGVGKALLVGLTREQRHPLLGSAPLERFTPRTITALAELDENLDQGVKNGYVVSLGEYRVGVTNVAVPIRTWNDVAIGCLNLSGYENELDESECWRLGAEMLRAAELLIYQAPSLEAASRYCRQ